MILGKFDSHPLTATYVRTEPNLDLIGTFLISQTRVITQPSCLFLIFLCKAFLSSNTSAIYKIIPIIKHCCHTKMLLVPQNDLRFSLFISIHYNRANNLRYLNFIKFPGTRKEVAGLKLEKAESSQNLIGQFNPACHCLLTVHMPKHQRPTCPYRSRQVLVRQFPEQQIRRFRLRFSPHRSDLTSLPIRNRSV